MLDREGGKGSNKIIIGFSKYNINMKLSGSFSSFRGFFFHQREKKKKKRAASNAADSNSLKKILDTSAQSTPLGCTGAALGNVKGCFSLLCFSTQL